MPRAIPRDRIPDLIAAHDRGATMTQLAAEFGVAVSTISLELAAAGRSKHLKPCGTAAAAVRHRRRGEPVDPECDAALRAYDQNRKLR